MSVPINDLEHSAAGRALALISATNLNKFVDFTSSLVREVFKTLIESTMEQLDSYADLVAKVSGTLATYEEKVLGTTPEVTALDYLNQVVLPTFAAPSTGSTTPPKITSTTSGSTVTYSPDPIQFDLTKKTDLVALFAGINAAVKVVPSGSTLTAGDQATFDALLLESTTNLSMATANLVSFAVAKLRQDVKFSYDKLVTLLKLGMQKIVVTDGEIDTSLTFHVGSTDSDESTTSSFQQDVSGRATSWALNGGLWGGRTFSGSVFGGILSRSFGYSLAGGIGSSSSQSSLQIHTVNEKSTAITTLSFDITGSLKLRFRSDFFPSLDPATLKVPV